MPLRDAILDLRNRVKALRGKLEALAELTESVGGGSVHALVEQVDKSAVDALGWAKATAKAVRRAVQSGLQMDAIRAALTDAQHALDQLRRKEPRRLRGRGLGSDLSDLCVRHERAQEAGTRRLGGWARDTIPLVRQVCAAARTADEAMATCWRELASQPVGPVGRIKVKTVTVVE